MKRTLVVLAAEVVGVEGQCQQDSRGDGERGGGERAGVGGDSSERPNQAPRESWPRRARRRQEDEALVTAQQIGLEALAEVVRSGDGGEGGAKVTLKRQILVVAVAALP